jgi:hypothetical protein
MSSFKVYTGQGDGSTPGGYYREPAPAKIDPQSEESLELWQKSLMLTRAELNQAIQKYGLIVRDIRRGLVNEKQDAA